MTKKIRIGVVLVLIGLGIPLVLWFFQKDGEIFRLRIEKRDKLREAEVITLNSLYELSESYKKEARIAWKDKAPDLLTTSQLTAIGTFDVLAETFKEIERLLWKVEFPNSGRIYKGDGKVVPFPPSGFKLVNPDEYGNFVLLTPVKYITGIPFNYSIGVGLIFIITGIGFILLSLIGRWTRVT